MGRRMQLKRVIVGLLALLANIICQACFAADTPAVATAIAKPLKIESAKFATLPFFTSPKLSPDGLRVLAKLNVNGVQSLGILSLFEKTDKIKIIPLAATQNLQWFKWITNSRILISVGYSDRLFDEKVFVTRLLSYDFNTKISILLGGKKQGIDGDNIIFTAADGSYILLSVQKSVFDYPSVFKVDTVTGDIKIEQTATKNIWQWFADNQGVVRLGIAFGETKSKFFYREKAGDSLKLTSTWKYDDSDSDIQSIKFGLDDKDSVIMTNAKTGRFGLYKFEATLEDKVGQPIFEHPENDIDDFWYADDGKTIEAVSYTDDRARVKWFDPALKEIQDEIDKSLPDRINWIVSTSKDRTKHLVWTYKPNDPGNYYYFDRSVGVLNRIASTYDQLRGSKLAPVKYVKYKARDGTVIPSYLTLPVGRAETNLPLIIMPHGGPFVRDSWEYDPWAQLLANRGYAVLQPNYRGSLGYGKAYLEKGYGQWGRAMQDDVLDGLKWLVDQKIADPKRVCIMGGSYGGYVAMFAAAKTPELFKCAISHAGISDMKAMLKYDRKFFRSKNFKSWKNKVQGEENFDLTSVSPLYSVNSVSTPILVTHGTKDTIVPIEQSEVFVKALNQAGKTVQYISFKDGKHSFESQKDHEVFLAAVDAFLAKYNPAD
jgi:dipeptidyl aminopeptidase/acylaminoacyl peptidase